MPLVPIEQFADILRCPRCRSELTPDEARWKCIGDCPPYVTSSGLPVLVDFDRSVLRRQDLAHDSGAERREDPGPLRRFILRRLLPYNERAEANARALLAELARQAAQSRLLVIGGGAIGSGAEALYEAPNVEIVGFDLYASPNVQLIADAHQMPFADQAFDAVWVQAVLEHVLEPQKVVDEIRRVLCPSGLVYAETPFLQPVHEGAYDFTRFTDNGHRWLFRDFERVDSGVVLGPFAQLLWSINTAVRSLSGSARLGYAAELLFFWLKYLDRLVPEERALDGASALFFLGRKSGTGLAASDLLDHYDRVRRH